MGLHFQIVPRAGIDVTHTAWIWFLKQEEIVLKPFGRWQGSSDQNVVIVMIVMTWPSSKSDKIMHSWQLLSTRDNEIIYDTPGPRIDGILIMEWDCEQLTKILILSEEWMSLNICEMLWGLRAISNAGTGLGPAVLGQSCELFHVRV